ncbi:hypothetical protein SARC_11843, partial [Sphaeroforma arctica JP610]
MFRTPTPAKNTRSKVQIADSKITDSKITDSNVGVSVTLRESSASVIPNMSSVQSTGSNINPAHATGDPNQYHDELVDRVNNLTEWI